jgi:hypothetical protein
LSGFVKRILQDAADHEKPYKDYDSDKIKLIVRNFPLAGIDGYQAGS